MSHFYKRAIGLMLVLSTLLTSGFFLTNKTTPKNSAYTLHISGCCTKDERVAPVKEKQQIAWLDAFRQQVINKPPYTNLDPPLNDWKMHLKVGGETYSFVFQDGVVQKTYIFHDEFIIYRESLHNMLLDEAVMALKPDQIKWFESNIKSLKEQAKTKKNLQDTDALKTAAVIGFFHTEKDAAHIVDAQPILDKDSIHELLLLSQDFYKRPLYLGDAASKLPHTSDILYQLETAYKNDATAYFLVCNGDKQYGVVLYEHFGEVMYIDGRRAPKSHFFKLDKLERERVVKSLRIFNAK